MILLEREKFPYNHLDDFNCKHYLNGDCLDPDDHGCPAANKTHEQAKSGTLGSIPWNKGMELLKEETDYSKRKEIVHAMQNHHKFQEDVRTRVLKAKKRRR